jgi:hypothetical protein
LPSSIDLQSWTRDEVLAHAYRRGTQLRRQRVVLSSAAALALAGLLGVGVVSAIGTKDAARVHTVDSPTTVLTQPPTTTPVTIPPSTTPTTTAAAARACAAGELVVTVTTDKPTYAAGETIHATATARNASSHPCHPIDEVRWSWTDAAGRAVTGGEGVYMDYVSGSAWAPGDTRQFTSQWNQRCDGHGETCPAGPAPRGRYTFRFTGGSGGSSFGGQAGFDLV